MTEEIKDINASEVEVQPGEPAEEQQVDVVAEDNVTENKEVSPQPVANKEENLRALRESRRKLQEERDLLAAKLLEAQNAKKYEQEDEDYLDEESKTSKELGEMRKYMSQMEFSNQRMKLQSEYPDFKKVVNEDSIAILKERYPEIAATLDRGTDIYSTGVSVYNVIKKFGLSIDEEAEVQKLNVNKNMAKPVPSTSMKNSSALASAKDYSDLSSKEVRRAIIEQARKCAQNM